ncbi:MAG: hypothetical protein ACRD1X_12850 [Vicinamibacteria bacterium]
MESRKAGQSAVLVRRSYLRWIVAALIVGAALIHVALTSGPTEGIRHHDLRGWTDPASLEIRLRSDDRVLLRPGSPYVRTDNAPAGDPGYVLDTDTLELSVAGREEWEAAESDIHRCDAHGYGSTSGVSFERNRSVEVGGHALAVAGRPRNAVVSPQGDIVAVLSGRGVRLPSWSPVPALGREDRLWGYRYHQLFSISSGESLGGVYALGFRKRDPNVCWEPKGRAILYSDFFFSDITVVRVASRVHPARGVSTR